MATQKTTGNPFLDYDVTKIMAEFDPAKFAGEFAKMAEAYKIPGRVPGLDLEAVLEVQRRNVEALTAANKTVAEGVRAIAKQQSEVLNQTLDAARKAFDKIGKAGTPQEAAVQQAEIAREVFAKAVTNAQELTELVAKSNSETAGVITGRIAEGLDEIKALAEKLEK